MWPGAEVNVDAGRRRDAVKAWQSLNSQAGPSPDAAFAELYTETDRTIAQPSLMRPSFDRPVYR